MATLSSLLLCGACSTKANPAWDDSAPWDRNATDGGTAETGEGSDGSASDEGTAGDGGIGTGGDGSDDSHGSDGSAETGGAPVVCEEYDEESNDDEPSAALGPDLECEASDATIFGTLADVDDRDWFEVGPVACLQAKWIRFELTASPEVDACVYYECEDGSAPEVSCSKHGAAVTSPQGRLGCCGTGVLDVQARCEQTHPNVTRWWIVVEPGEAAQCTPYQIQARVDPDRQGQGQGDGDGD